MVIYKEKYTTYENGDIYGVHGKKLKPAINRCGYLYVNIRKDGGYNSEKVHRIVAISFIPNPENKPEVNHKDGNKLNNCVDNLEWVTKSENLKHAYKIGSRIGAVLKVKQSNSKPVVNIDTGQVYGSAKEASEKENKEYFSLANKLNGNAKNNTNLKYINN